MSTGVITTGNFPRALFPGVKKFYQMAYKDWKEEYKKLFDMETSKKAYEISLGFSGTGLAPVKPEGQAVQYDSMEQGFESRFTHATYALGIIVTKEEYDDNLYPKLIKRRSAALKRSQQQTRENVGANIYNRAFSSSYTGGDGVSLLNASHPRKSGAGVYSNILGTAADLSESSLEQACIDIGGFTDEVGLKIQAMPESLHIPKELTFDAERILGSVLQNDTANNAINALRSLGKFPKGTHINHYFSDTDAWFIRTDVPDGMVFYVRQEPELLMDNDSDTFNAKYITWQRFSTGWEDPRQLFGSAGA